MTCDRIPAGLLRSMLLYLRQVTGLLALGSLAGIAVNTAVVLPAIALGHAIDVAVAVAQNAAPVSDLTRAAMLVVAAALARASRHAWRAWSAPSTQRSLVFWARIRAASQAARAF